MGSNFWPHTAAWTFLYLVQVLTADRSLFQDLGLNALPDATKINISQDEYTRMMTTYLDARRKSLGVDNDSIPNLTTFKMVENKEWWPNREGDSSARLKFSIRKTSEESDVESAQLRILAPPLDDGSLSIVRRVKVLQVLGTRRRRLIDEKDLYLSSNSTKWCEFDITSAVRSWLNGDRNLGLELACIDCKNSFQPVDADVSALVYPEHRRFRRSNSPFRSRRATDCRQSRKGSTKRRCCRHEMLVKFSDLKYPEMKYIVQPATYEAGFCQGQCPPNFNHATNHSRIQSLIHQMDRKNARQPSHHRVPKACCTPSKLKPLEILRVSPADSTKLVVEKWDNMEVVECACS